MVVVVGVFLVVVGGSGFVGFFSSIFSFLKYKLVKISFVYFMVCGVWGIYFQAFFHSSDA